jgi:SAM-dependent methyltransferase
MEHTPISEMELLIQTHVGLERQGPGSSEVTRKALGFIENLDPTAKIADLACGTGGQTMVLAKNTVGSIVGVDLCPAFIEVLNANAQKENLCGRVTGVVGDMEDLPFQNEEFDLIWSEGAIDAIGFAKGLRYWHGFLKRGGYAAVSCPSWLTEERPPEVGKFWADAGSGLDSVEENLGAMQSIGYRFIAAFALPETCWTERYFAPRTAAEQALLKRYGGSPTMEAYLANSRYEMDLYARFNRHYGYVFYIGQKR